MSTGLVPGGIELETLPDFDDHIRINASLAGCYLQSLDLRERGSVLARVAVSRAVFLGCHFAEGAEADLERRGALIFPQLPDLPFDPYRAGLYTADELYSGLEQGHRHTLDARIYRWWRHVGRDRSLSGDLAMALHDHAITESLADLGLEQVVGVMGGHQVERGSPGYRDAALLGRGLASIGQVVLTGGGPGAMEAANLGAALNGTVGELEQALALLGATPGFSDDITSWVRVALEVREQWDLTGPSYGIPTWLYGHEPPNVFNLGLAKLFSNAIREDVLLRSSANGLVCLPGAVGTVQEIFQAVTPRYYVGDGDAVPPLILVGRDYWTHTLPVWPLLQSLAGGHPMRSAMHLVDRPQEVLPLLSLLA